MMTTHTIYYTKKFTAGLLTGLSVNCSLSFPTLPEAARFARKMRPGTAHKGLGRERYEITDLSFQRYDRGVAS